MTLYQLILQLSTKKITKKICASQQKTLTKLRYKLQFVPFTELRLEALSEKDGTGGSCTLIKTKHLLVGLLIFCTTVRGFSLKIHDKALLTHSPLLQGDTKG
jgi:hypothetical protein